MDKIEEQESEGLHFNGQDNSQWSSFVEKMAKERMNSSVSSDSLLSSSQGHTDNENNDHDSAGKSKSHDNSSFYASENSSLMNSDLDSDSSHSGSSSSDKLNELVTSDMFLNHLEIQEYSQLEQQESFSISTEMDSDVDQWGWFDDNDHAMCIQEGRNVRSAWYKTVDSLHPGGSHIQPVKSDLEFSLLETLSMANPQGNLRMSEVDENNPVIVQWMNPNPSMSLISSKSLSNHCTSSSSSCVPVGDEMQISGCIHGFRIKLSELGTMHAEFQYVVCYGSETFNSWKRFGEFEKLHEIIRHFHDNGHRNFPKTVQQWNNIKQKQRSYRCFSISYLIEKSVYLGRYIQDLLIESEGPGLLLMFARCEKIEL